MYIHDVQEILTINVRDFGRFEGITAVHPGDVNDSADDGLDNGLQMGGP